MAKPVLVDRDPILEVAVTPLPPWLARLSDQKAPWSSSFIGLPTTPRSWRYNGWASR